MADEIYGKENGYCTITYVIKFHYGTASNLLFDIVWSNALLMRYEKKKMTVATIHMLNDFHNGTANYLLNHNAWSNKWLMRYKEK
jgi:hypothetical protein